MRSSLLLLAPGLLAASAVLAQAPVTAPPQPPLPMGVPAAPAAAPARAAAPAAPPGVVTLSDVARQAPAVAEPLPVAPAAAADRSPEPGLTFAPAPVLVPPPVNKILLMRISSVGADTTAVLWVRGRHRKVAAGARVLQYTVGEIRDDGVCLYQPRPDGRIKDRCQEMVTFAQGV